MAGSRLGVLYLVVFVWHLLRGCLRKKVWPARLEKLASLLASESPDKLCCSRDGEAPEIDGDSEHG